ncbi:Hypothetical protein NF53_p2063 (plasmid) [Bacillus thuringiensis serovar indiana]|nr:Hypothetical protein NF53_p2063 [Bacillus thuringiensis serovar indiana]
MKWKDDLPWQTPYTKSQIMSLLYHNGKVKVNFSECSVLLSPKNTTQLMNGLVLMEQAQIACGSTERLL